jgi:hypothetical protein
MPRYAKPNSTAPTVHIRTFLVPKEVAEERHCAEETLCRERALGEGPPFYRIGGRIFYDRDELDAWYAERRKNAA